MVSARIVHPPFALGRLSRSLRDFNRRMRIGRFALL